MVLVPHHTKSRTGELRCLPPRSPHILAKKIGKDFSFPKAADRFQRLLLIEFYSIANVNRFQREHNHSSGRGRRCTQNHDFANSSAWHIVGVNDWSMSTVKESGVDNRRLILSQFIGFRFKRKRVNRVAGYRTWQPLCADEVTNLQSLVRANV